MAARALLSSGGSLSDSRRSSPAFSGERHGPPLPATSTRAASVPPENSKAPSIPGQSFVFQLQSFSGIQQREATSESLSRFSKRRKEAQQCCQKTSIFGKSRSLCLSRHGHALTRQFLYELAHPAKQCSYLQRTLYFVFS